MRRALILVVALLTLMAIAPAAFAGQGGKPAAHDLEGSEWGKAVSDLARTAPGAVADHIEDQKGAPDMAAHEVDVEVVGDELDEPNGKAYGWHITNAFGMSYGQVLKAYKAQFEDLEFVGPHGETEPLPVVGAKVFWLVHMPL